VPSKRPTSRGFNLGQAPEVLDRLIGARLLVRQVSSRGRVSRILGDRPTRSECAALSSDAEPGVLVTPKLVSGSTLTPSRGLRGSLTGALEHGAVEGSSVHGHEDSPRRVRCLQRIQKKGFPLQQFRHCRYTIRVIGPGWRRPYTGIPPSICTESPFQTDRIAGFGRKLNEASRRRQKSSGAGRRHDAGSTHRRAWRAREDHECADSAGGGHAALDLIEV
jgi:hypothetical protein